MSPKPGSLSVHSTLFLLEIRQPGTVSLLVSALILLILQQTSANLLAMIPNTSLIMWGNSVFWFVQQDTLPIVSITSVRASAPQDMHTVLSVSALELVRTPILAITTEQPTSA